jgi:ABC-type lipopolysaccharide export system ATPase subunit
VEESLKSVNLFHSGFGDKSASTYSGGMKRRLSAAIALIGNPKVLLSAIVLHIHFPPHAHAQIIIAKFQKCSTCHDEIQVHYSLIRLFTWMI